MTCLVDIPPKRVCCCGKPVNSKKCTCYGGLTRDEWVLKNAIEENKPIHQKYKGEIKTKL